MDPGSTSCYVLGIDSDEQVQFQKRIPTDNEEIVSYFEAIEEPLKLHMEASTMAGHLRYLLQNRTEEVIISDPKENAKIHSDRSKGDKRDARHLAELLKHGYYFPVWYPDQKLRWVFRQVVRHYEVMKASVRAMKNRVHARYLMNGVFDVNSDVHDPEQREAFLQQIDYPVVPEIMKQLHRVVEDDQAAWEEARKLMFKVGSWFPGVELLQTIPGVGPVISCRVVGYLGDPHRFSSNKEVRKYFQLAITDETSDQKQLGYSRLDPEGRPQLKDCTYWAWQGARRGENALSRYYDRQLREKGDQTKARLKTQRKIADTMWANWCKEEEYRDQRVTSQVC